MSLFAIVRTPYLVALYCAIPRDYLSDTPLLCAMGFLVSQHGQLGAIPLPLFSAFPPWRSFAKWRSDTPPSQKGYLSDTRAIPYENKANGCDTLSAMLSRKGIARYGGVSRTGPLKPHTEPGILDFQGVHFRVPKMPRKWAPKRVGHNPDRFPKKMGNP